LDQLPPGNRINEGFNNWVFSTNPASPVVFPIQTAIAFPKAYLDILPSVSADKVTVAVGASVVLFAATEIGIVVVLGSKSAKKQFVFCAKSDVAQTIAILREAIVLTFRCFILLYWLST
jgi:hypothetical protein